MTDSGIDNSRRRLLTVTTTSLCLVGLVGMIVPFAGSLNPSEKAKVSGAPVTVDISELKPFQQIIVNWRGKPVWIIRRSKEMLNQLSSLSTTLVDPNSEVDHQPVYAQNIYRSIKKEVLVLVGICTHLGCSPKYQPNMGDHSLVNKTNKWKGGFFCACHGSKFDISGRVYKGVPAPTNLIVPPHQYLSDTIIQVGEDGGIA